MEQIELKMTTREVLGKKVRFLRRQGVTPAHLFGHNVESRALQCETPQLKQVLSQAGKTRLIDLKLDRAKKPRKVMVREVQKNILTGELIHVDFYEVSMAEEIKLDVPIVLVGEAPALKSKENQLTRELNRLTIECLPGKVPVNIPVDISSLTEVDQAIRVKDIDLGKDITILNDAEVVLVRTSYRPVEVVEEKVVAEEVVEVAKGAEEAPAEEKPEEEPKEKK